MNKEKSWLIFIGIKKIKLSSRLNEIENENNLVRVRMSAKAQ